MARRAKKARFLSDGLLVVDKPAGISSAEVVNRLKRAAGPQRIGHTGTLDPFATGVLVICFNRATKLAGHLMDQKKVYQGVMMLGIATDTYDVEGKITSRRAVSATEDEVIFASAQFIGRIDQRPPAYSALKQGGEALYRKARRGEEVQVDTRPVVIDRLEVTAFEPPRVHFEVECGKGTYIRSLAHDWGRALGCGGHLETLRRTRSGPFTTDQALTIGLAESLAGQGRLVKRLIEPARALPEWPEAVLDADSATMVTHGRSLPAADLEGLKSSEIQPGNKIKLVTGNGELIALAQLVQATEDGEMAVRPIRVLQISS